MKLVRAKLKHTQFVGGVGLTIKDLTIGQPCGPTFGGGTIRSLEVDRATASIVVRRQDLDGKPARFNASPVAGVGQAWDCTLVPLVAVDCIMACDDEPQGQQKGK